MVQSVSGITEHGLRGRGLNCGVNLCVQNGLNALHLAAKEGHVELVEELLERGAAVDSSTKVWSIFTQTATDGGHLRSLR